jgi:molybdopterin/thiamine biosynthesis adenylyltransferase
VAGTPEALAKYTLIVATGLSEAALLAVADVCWRHGIPLLVARAYGLVGYLRIVVPEHHGASAGPPRRAPPTDPVWAHSRASCRAVSCSCVLYMRACLCL